MKDKWVVLNQILDSFKEIADEIGEILIKGNLVKKFIGLSILAFLITGMIIYTDSFFDVVIIVFEVIITLIIMSVLGRFLRKMHKYVYTFEILGWILVYFVALIITRRMLTSAVVTILGIYLLIKINSFIKPREIYKKERGKRIIANIIGVIVLFAVIQVMRIPIKGMNKPEYRGMKYFIGKGVDKEYIHIIESRKSYKDKGIDVVIDIGDISLLENKRVTDDTGKKLPYVIEEYVLWYDNGKIREEVKLEKEPYLEQKWRESKEKKMQ